MTKSKIKKMIPRRPFVAGNWKMHRTASDTKALIGYRQSGPKGRHGRHGRLPSFYLDPCRL